MVRGGAGIGAAPPWAAIRPCLEDIDADLALLAEDLHAARTYEVRDTLAAVPRPMEST